MDMDKKKLFESLQMQGLTAQSAKEYIAWLQQDRNDAVARHYRKERPTESSRIATPLSLVYMTSEKDDLQAFPFLDVSRADNVIGIEMNGRYWCREDFSWRGCDFPRRFSKCLTKNLSPAVETVSYGTGFKITRNEYEDVTSIPIKGAIGIDLYVPAIDDLRINDRDIQLFNQTVRIMRNNAIWAEYWDKSKYVAVAKKEWGEIEFIGHDFTAECPYFCLSDAELYIVRPIILVDYSD